MARQAKKKVALPKRNLAAKQARQSAAGPMKDKSQPTRQQQKIDLKKKLRNE